MARGKLNVLAQLVGQQESVILSEWLDQLRNATSAQAGRIQQAELQTQCRNFLDLLRQALTAGEADVTGAAYAPVLDLLGSVSRSRALQGFTPAETATFVFSLKEPLFEAANRALGKDAVAYAQTIREITTLIDELGMHTVNVYQKSREEIIVRQQREISELSTPVVKLWDGILALPVIGTLDSERTQVVMENLLQTIVDHGAEIAIIDITGVPTVDTLTAQHLLKTIAAARLMGADCIISGIRPQIAQTMVHLGVELNVISKATLADAFAVALRRLNRAVFAIKTPAAHGNGSHAAG
ncbi:MAG TPA: STAS domain-containing protein [Steroidobacteraceae bacterium]|jgi:rsbT co-antagonist protein RsbR